MSYFAAHRRALLDSQKANNAFTILVDTTRAGSANNTMQLPIRGTNMVIDWGDGFVQTVTQDALPISTNWVTRVYASPGNYQIRIGGGLNWIRFNNTGDRLKLMQIRNWGSTVWASLEQSFWGCSNMTGVFTDTPNLSNVTHTNDMFNGATLFNSPIGNWNMGNITHIGGMLAATRFNQPISEWNVGNVVNMQYVFWNNTFFNQNIGAWNTQSVTTMAWMFQGATAFNQNIGTWNTQSVTAMNNMFQGATAFNQNIGTWNTGNVVNMEGAFWNAQSFNQPIGVWNVSKVTNMHLMFHSAFAFNHPLMWNTGNVINMNNMFTNAIVFNQNLSTWCVWRIATLPTGFDVGATAWVLPRPIWGTCP